MSKASDPHLITSAPRAAQDEASERTTRYIYTMALRLICIVLAIVITPHGWYSWLFIAGAAFLPTVGVIVANIAKNDGSRGEKPSIEIEQQATSPSLKANEIVIDIPAVTDPNPDAAFGDQKTSTKLPGEDNQSEATPNA